MSPIRGTARLTGVLYLLMALPGPFTLMYIPRHFIVARDATATANNIMAAEFTYRLGILAGLISSVAFVFLVLSLYRLLRDVDRHQARLMVSFVLVAVAVGFVDLILQSAPLVLLHGGDALSAFTKTQIDALAYTALRMRNTETNIASALWGLWLLPFGILVFRSGFIPKFVGVLLIVGCFAYLAGSLTSILFPSYMRAVSMVTLPLAGPGELSILLWLLIKGGNVPLPQVVRA